MRIEVEIFSSDILKAKGHVVCVCIALSQDKFQFSSANIPSQLRDKMMNFSNDYPVLYMATNMFNQDPFMIQLSLVHDSNRAVTVDGISYW